MDKYRNIYYVVLPHNKKYQTQKIALKIILKYLKVTFLATKFSSFVWERISDK